MEKWTRQIFVQRYNENLIQMRQNLLQNFIRQQNFHNNSVKLTETLVQPTRTIIFDANGQLDPMQMAKAKERRLCQEMYEKLLVQLQTTRKMSASSNCGTLADEGKATISIQNVFNIAMPTNLLPYDSVEMNQRKLSSLSLPDLNFINYRNVCGNGISSSFLFPKLSCAGINTTTINYGGYAGGKCDTLLPASPSSSSTASGTSFCDTDNGYESRPYKCTICDKKFRFKSNLFEHKSLHVKSVAFHCPFCGKSCRLKGNLKKHLQVHINTIEDLERLWKKRFSRSSGRPRKDAPPRPLPAIGDDLGLVPINKKKSFVATWVYSNEMSDSPSQ